MVGKMISRGAIAFGLIGLLTTISSANGPQKKSIPPGVAFSECLRAFGFSNTCEEHGVCEAQGSYTKISDPDEDGHQHPVEGAVTYSIGPDGKTYFHTCKDPHGGSDFNLTFPNGAGGTSLAGHEEEVIVTTSDPGIGLPNGDSHFTLQATAAAALARNCIATSRTMDQCFKDKAHQQPILPKCVGQSVEGDKGLQPFFNILLPATKKHFDDKPIGFSQSQSVEIQRACRQVTGGDCKDGVISLQGDQGDAIRRQIKQNRVTTARSWIMSAESCSQRLSDSIPNATSVEAGMILKLKAGINMSVMNGRNTFPETDIPTPQKTPESETNSGSGPATP